MNNREDDIARAGAISAMEGLLDRGSIKKTEVEFVKSRIKGLYDTIEDREVKCSINESRDDR